MDTSAFDPPIHEKDYTDAGEYAWHLADLLGARGSKYYRQAWSLAFGTHIYKAEKVYIYGPFHGIDGHVYVNGPVTIEVQVSRETAEKIMAILAEEWQPYPSRFCGVKIEHGSKTRDCLKHHGHEGPHSWGREYY